MLDENGQMNGDIAITQPFRLRGIATGRVTVRSGGTLHLNGICNGDLMVDAGGIAIIDGVVVGSIFNFGTVEVRGIVRGNVETSSGNFQQAPGAIVQGKVSS